MGEHKIKMINSCEKDWTTMSKTEQGKFCQFCSKEVVNFTTHSDQEIVKYFQENGNVCGRFKKDQLERPLVLPKMTKDSSRYYYFLLSGLLFFSNTHQVASQVHKIPPVPLETSKDTTESFPDSVKTTKPLEKEEIISGTVTDYEGEPLFQSVIKLEGTQLMAQSDFDGNYTIKLPKGTILPDSLNLIFCDIFLNTMDTITIKQKFPQVINHQFDTTHLELEMGITVVIKEYKKPSLIKRLIHRFSSNDSIRQKGK